MTDHDPRIDIAEQLNQLLGGVPLVKRRCRRCKGAVRVQFDAYLCGRCGVLPAGIFDADPTEEGMPR